MFPMASLGNPFTLSLLRFIYKVRPLKLRNLHRDLQILTIANVAQDSYSSKSSLESRLDIHCVRDTPGNSFHSNFMTGRRDRVRNINPTTGNSFCIKYLKKRQF